MVAPNSCEPCNCIPVNWDPDYFRTSVVTALCGILTAIEDGELGTDVNLASIGGAAVTVAGLGIHLEDVAAVSGDAGVAALFKRTDTAAAQTDATGDYTFGVTNSFGAQHVNIDSTFQRSAATGLLKDASGAFAVTDTGVALMGVCQKNGTMVNLGSNTQSTYTALAVGPAGYVFADINTQAIASATLANSIVKTEDLASANGDTGVMVLAKQQAVPTNDVGSDGDYQCLKTTAYGEQWTQRGGAAFLNILTATTTTVKSGVGILHRIIVNKAVANGVYTIYDNTAGSGTKIGTVTQPAAVLQSQGVLEYGVRFSTGLTIVTGSTDDITVVYS